MLVCVRECECVSVRVCVRECMRVYASVCECMRPNTLILKLQCLQMTINTSCQN